MLYRVEGIVIRSMDYGEGNKIIGLYSGEAGKVSVMARGAKKVNSRLAAVTQVFTHGQYTYYKAKSGQMGSLNDAEAIDSFPGLQTDLYKSAYAAYLVEMVDRIVEDKQQGSSFLFSQLLAGLQEITEGKDMQIIAHIFELRMLADAGYSPSLAHCVSCGESVQEGAISVQAGGVVCRKCRGHTLGVKPVSEKAWKLLRLFQQVDLRRLGNVTVSLDVKAEIKAIMRGFMDHHINVNWKSRGFIEQMEKYEL